MKIVKTIGGDLYMVTSSEVTKFVNLSTGAVCSGIDAIDTICEISIHSRRISENTILYNSSLNYYAITKEEMPEGFYVKGLYKKNSFPRNKVYGFAGKSNGWRIATPEEISILYELLSEINYDINENGEFVTNGSNKKL